MKNPWRAGLESFISLHFSSQPIPCCQKEGNLKKEPIRWQEAGKSTGSEPRPSRCFPGQFAPFKNTPRCYPCPAGASWAAQSESAVGGGDGRAMSLSKKASFPRGVNRVLTSHPLTFSGTRTHHEKHSKGGSLLVRPSQWTFAWQSEKEVKKD